MKILVTGSAGFIDSNLVLRLIETHSFAHIVGLDNMNDRHRFDVVINLAAQAGMRYSIQNPDVFIESNIVGFYNTLEACRHHPVKLLVYASSCSIYGSNNKTPFSETDNVDSTVSLYAATKKSNELLAHSHSKLYNISTTGMRFFTVYGPAGRPDMAYFGFTDKLVKGESIEIFNYSNCRRDFTNIDDIIEGIMRMIDKPQPYAHYNIGNSSPENLLEFTYTLQEELVIAGVLPEDYDLSDHQRIVPMQPGDVKTTYADSTRLERNYRYNPPHATARRTEKVHQVA